MSERLEQFLQEIEQKLDGKVSAQRSEEILRELRSHLWMSRKSAIEELEMPDYEADQLAIRMVGTSQLIAEDLIRRESGIETKSIWRVAFVPGLLLILAHMAPWALIAMRHREWIDLSHWFHFIVLAAVGIAAYRSRRWLLAPLACCLLISTVLTGIASFSVTTPQPKWAVHAGLDRNVAEAKLALRGDLSMSKVDQGYRTIKEQRTNVSVLYPYMPMPVTIRSENVLTQAIVPTAQEARELWKSNGSAWISHLEQFRADYDKNLSPLGMVSLTAPKIFGFFAWEVYVLTLVNGSALALAAHRRRRSGTSRKVVA